ncbi:hypothetical protein, partial [Paenibacillus humicus]|uniref:hypothetical protein n=1 Tax=Paenibacillus humicus TaxID=412861 RepID=UPI003D286A8B
MTICEKNIVPYEIKEERLKELQWLLSQCIIKAKDALDIFSLRIFEKKVLQLHINRIQQIQSEVQYLSLCQDDFLSEHFALT